MEEELLRARLPFNRGNPFQTLRVDLASSNATQWRGVGYGIIFRREGSAPGARLDIEVGGRVECLYPGSRIVGPFDAFTVQRAERSSLKGLGYLIVQLRPDADFVEPAEVPGQLCAPVDLLGDSSVLNGTFVSVPEDTAPTGDLPTGAFDTTGWSRIRVFLSGSGLVSADLIPWVREPKSQLWFPQPDALRAVVDSAATGYDRRVMLFDLEATGQTFLEVRSLLPAPLTHLGMIVQGVR
jgi:hypothetical protein